MTAAIHIFLDLLLVASFVVAVIVIVGGIQFGLLVAWVNFLQHRYRRQQARRPGYITDDPSFRGIYVDRDMTQWQDCRITGSPWRNR